VPILTDSEIEEGLAGSQWRRHGEAIAREWQLESFQAAIDFVNEVAAAAEQANHHPDIRIHGWNKVELELSTHSQGGITINDLNLAKVIDRLS
jgi:4a-hydroxytetrahydrobiopterin dehydratase